MFWYFEFCKFSVWSVRQLWWRRLVVAVACTNFNVTPFVTVNAIHKNEQQPVRKRYVIKKYKSENKYRFAGTSSVSPKSIEIEQEVAYHSQPYFYNDHVFTKKNLTKWTNFTDRLRPTRESTIDCHDWSRPKRRPKFNNKQTVKSYFLTNSFYTSTQC